MCVCMCVYVCMYACVEYAFYILRVICFGEYDLSEMRHSKLVSNIINMSSSIPRVLCNKTIFQIAWKKKSNFCSSRFDTPHRRKRRRLSQVG